MKKPVSTVRKVSLMGAGNSAKKTQQSTQSVATVRATGTQLQKSVDGAYAQANGDQSIATLCKRLFLWLVTATVAAVLFLPKPQLVYYSVRGKEEHSVYWPGFDDGAFEGRLLDADYAAAINEETKILYLCNRGVNGRVIDHCSKYKINQTKGLLPALLSLAKQDRIY